MSSFVGFVVSVEAVGGASVVWKVIGGLERSRRQVRDGERGTPQVLSSQSVFLGKRGVG